MNSFCDENTNVLVSVVAQRLVECLPPEDSKQLLVIVNLFAANLSFLIAQQLVCAPENHERDLPERERHERDKHHEA